MLATISETRIKINRLDKRIAALKRERETLLIQLSQEDGWKPCDDCFAGYCHMNCSSAPGYMKVYL